MEFYNLKNYTLDIISKMEKICGTNNALNARSMDLLVLEPLNKCFRDYEGNMEKEGFDNLKNYVEKLQEYSLSTTAQYNSLSILDEMKKLKELVPKKKLSDIVEEDYTNNV